MLCLKNQWVFGPVAKTEEKSTESNNDCDQFIKDYEEFVDESKELTEEEKDALEDAKEEEDALDVEGDELDYASIYDRNGDRGIDDDFIEPEFNYRDYRHLVSNYEY